MKITKLPDEPTPDRAMVKPRRQRSQRRVGINMRSLGFIKTDPNYKEETDATKQKRKRTQPTPKGYHGVRGENPMWDARQLALIEEFKKAGPNHCVK